MNINTDNDLLLTSEEERNLGVDPPLKTIMKLSFGPLVSQIASALYSLVDSIYIAATIGEKGVAVFGAVFVVDFIAFSIAKFLSTGLSVRLSYLFGQNNKKDCAQMYVDFLQISMFFGVLIPLLVLPVTKPLVIWFGADEALGKMCLQYMIPHAGGSFFTIIFYLGCGVVQAQGQSKRYAGIQCIAFLLNCLVFDPIFLVWLRLPVWGAALSTILSHGIPGIVLMVLTFRGKMIFFPEWSMFTKKFSDETWPGIKVGFSTLIDEISSCLPCILLQKYVNMAAIAIGQYNNVVICWAIVEKLYLIVGGVCIGFSEALLSSASYAFGAGRMNRVLWLFIHSLWLSTLTTFSFSIICVIFPRKISQFWSSNPEFLSISEKMLPILFYAASTLGFQYIVPAVLQATMRVFLASILSIITMMIPLPLFSTYLYYSGDGKHNPVRVMFTYVMNDLFSLIMDILFILIPLRSLTSTVSSSKGFDPISSTKDIHYEDEDIKSITSYVGEEA